MQSELDSLKQRVIELLAENTEIKAENAKVKAENAKLRQTMEENEARFVKLEQSDKEKAELIAELNRDVGKIKQEQIAINVSVQDGTSVVKSPTRSELQVTSQSSISPPIEDEDDVQVIDGNQELTTDMTIEVKLVHLFLEVSIEGKNTTQARQKEISCRYSYGKRFEESVQEIIASDNVSDQTARKQLFQDIIKHLSGITLETLRKRTQRAIKIYKLFKKIGVDRIKNIKSYSADSISKFTKPQIQIILNYFGGSCYADAEIKKPNSYSECKDIEKVRPKVPLEKSQGSVPKKLPDVKISTPPTSQTSKTNQTNALEVQKKYLDSVEILDQYPNLYRECSIENFDYYGITDETTCRDYICPLCKLGHDDEEIEGIFFVNHHFVIWG
ncbi:hypothetical protein RhiirA5_457914 [Rhizophagus irregularis]|uniref:Uncharacterized protein n=1 Tax=Rhizophagus irregularis TaxID=588596 RepID=A0A2N0P233_9GLOM|nr:hypothetical protein RhiirA5_457914 [Rhizophagus irregularis]